MNGANAFGSSKAGSASTSRATTTFEEDVRGRVTSILDKDAVVFFREIQDDIKDGPITSASLAALKAAEERKASRNRSWKIFNRVVSPVVNLLTGYYNVIDTICQADPTPGAVIWGCLKILINSAHRAANLFEAFGEQIDRVRFHLKRINHFKALFHESDAMSDVLHRSCLNVVTFCTLVWKECKRSTPVFLLKSLSPSLTRDFEKISSAIKVDREDLEDMGGWIDQERGDSHRQEFAKFLTQQQEEQKWKTYQSAVQWLGGQSSATSQERVESSRPETTVVDSTDWILGAPEFQAWTSDSASHPVLWLTATPGAGKTMLCSQVIQKTKEKFPSAGIASYFYRFDERIPTSQVLQSIAKQLLEQLWMTNKELPDSVSAFPRTPPNMKSSILGMIRAMAESTAFTKIFIFLDGVDEDASEGPPDLQSARQALSDLIPLTDPASKGTFRLWISSQYRTHIAGKLKSHLRVQLSDQNESALRSFFDQELPQLRKLELEQEELDELVDMLRDMVKGNFLWARCMIGHLRDVCESPEEVQEFIETSQPWSLDEYYKNLLRRTREHDRDLASKILSIVCFARRRVSVSELRDALCMMRSSGSKEPRKKPVLHKVKTLLPPFIVTSGSEEDESGRCELFHSTARGVLQANPGILEKDHTGLGSISINEYHLAWVCVRYLADPKFKEPLKLSDGQWKTCSGEAIESDGFLRYSAKYWDKHLDAVKPSPELKALVSRFVLSPNYQTLLQLQHIYVDSHFATFMVVGRPENQLFLRRVFPDWFAPKDTPIQGFHIRRGYREFIHEWHYYLKCGCCENPRCVMSQFAGEVDRCLFGALGQENFMSHMHSRYVSFKLSNNDATGIQSTRQCYEGYSNAGDLVHVLQFASRTMASKLRFVCETWHLMDMKQPSLYKRQFVEVGEESHWPLYFKMVDGDVKARYDQAKPIAFDESGSCLRIGSSIFLRDRDGNFNSQQPGSSERDQPPEYFEEFAMRPGILAIASRRNSAKLGPERSNAEDAVQDVVALFARAQKEDSESDADESEPSSEGEETSSTSSDDGWSSVDESWSEASTEPSDALEDENILSVFKGYGGSSESEASADSETEETESETSSGSELGGNPFARFYKGYHDDSSDADEAYVAFGDNDSDEDLIHAFLSYRRRRRPKKQTERDLQASIHVFSTSESGMQHLFRLRQPLHLPLYDSAPALHPSLPLVVWPLGPSTILLLDYERKQYFTRKLRPTTSLTRQVFIKCRFSPDGQHLHIATLEAHRDNLTGSRRKQIKKQKRRNNNNNNNEDTNPTTDPDPDPLHLSLFLSTYRLHPHKPTRTPPAQTHRAKLALGAVHALPVARLPVAVTWTPQHLYVTQSARTLRVHRVRLFPPPPPPSSLPKDKTTTTTTTTITDDDNNDDNVNNVNINSDHLTLAEPREPIFLPATAAKRSVRFFPGTTTAAAAAAAAARVLIGSETMAPARPLTRGITNGGGSNDDEHVEEAGAAAAAAASSEPKFEGVQGLEGRASAPVGVYLTEGEGEGGDLGGWVASASGVRLPENRGLGRLDDKVERFDVDDDCDLEPYIV
ncbi:nacht domain protein [Diplodia corticola]|uniref:Nacht domain protein n=1 Tax=Diplodia corticola TaxID=236234 RepID=A0A1J9SAF2_9PEZI|nr:nacht domain protein [Diplodia corticola]OJD36549.1 nacht domain protein [Diplodia corticola]